MDKLSEKTQFDFTADHYIIRKTIGSASIVVALTPAEVHELCDLYIGTGLVESAPFPKPVKTIRERIGYPFTGELG